VKPIVAIMEISITMPLLVKAFALSFFSLSKGKGTALFSFSSNLFFYPVRKSYASLAAGLPMRRTKVF
jgi:hypothetical protein